MEKNTNMKKKKETFYKVTDKTKKIHKIYHNFCDYMKKWYFEYYFENKFDKKSGEFVKGKRQLKVFSSENLVGYIAQKRIEKYVESHPEIKIVRCDDSVFSTSIIVLIPHPTMGITFLYVPQNNTNIKNELFLYPDHSEMLIKELIKMRKKCLVGNKLYKRMNEVKKLYKRK